MNNSYPAANLPTGGSYVSSKTNISYIFPGYQNGSDNVVMEGQVIDVPSTSYFSLQMLASTESAGTSGNMTFEYTDGTTTLAEVRTNPYSSFLSILQGEIVMPSYFTSNDTNWNTSQYVDLSFWPSFWPCTSKLTSRTAYLSTLAQSILARPYLPSLSPKLPTRLPESICLLCLCSNRKESRSNMCDLRKSMTPSEFRQSRL